jgi:integrase
MAMKRRNILRSESGKWVVHKRIHGKQMWKTFGSLAEAEIFLAELTQQVARGTYRPPTKIRLDELIDEWVESAARFQLSERTYQTYVTSLNHHVRPSLGTYWLNEVTPRLLERWVADWASRGPMFQSRLEALRAAERTEARAEQRPLRPVKMGSSPGTVANGVTAVQRLFADAVRWEYVPVSPARELFRPRPAHHEVRCLTADEVERLILATPEPWRPLVLTAVTTGARQGELRGLKWSDLNLDTGHLQIRRSISRAGTVQRPKTKTSVRTITLPATVCNALRRHKLKSRYCTDTDYIFASESGAPIDGPNFVRRHFQPAVDRAGLAPLRFHDLRHACASLLIAQGEHPKLIAGQLGHASVQTTLDRYGHLLPSSFDDAAQRLADTLAAAIEAADSAETEEADVVPLNTAATGSA